MTMGSADSQTMHIDSRGYHLALRVIVLKHSYVLPWNQFLYAEGGNDEIHLIFTTHDVVVKGSNLNSLMAAIAAHGLAYIQTPVRPDRFVNPAGPAIHEIFVKKAEQE
jgi:hypothetical protein